MWIYRPVALALVALVVSCRLSPVESNASNQNLAGIPNRLVDDNYRIRLDWPGQGWQLLDPKGPESSVAAPGLCAYDEEQSLSGCVSVSHAPAASLEAYVDDWLHRFQLSNPIIVKRAKSDFQEQPAELFEVVGSYLGQPSCVSGIIFFHQNHAYRVLVRGPSDRFDRTRSQRFMDSVHLLPGKVKDPPATNMSRRLSGLGWRVANGTYENAIKNFRVAAGSGWTFVVGRELREFNPDADVVILHENPEVSLAVRVEPAKGGKSRGSLSVLQENHRRNLHVQLLRESPKVQVRGTPCSARLGRADNGNMVAYCSFRVGDKAIDVTAGFSELYRAASLTLLEQAVRGIDFVPSSDRVALAHQLMLETEADHSAGRDYSLRNGCFHSYAQGFAWCPPRGFWDFTLGDDARVNHGWAVLGAKNVQSGLSFRLFSRSGFNNDSLFQSLVDEHRLREVPPSPGTPFTRVAMYGPRSADGVSEGDVDFLYALRQNSDEIAALISCNANVPNCREQSEALVQGFRAEDRKSAIDFSDNALIDRRLGIIQKLPPTYRAKSRNDLSMEGGQRAVWESPESSVTLVTALTKDTVTGTSDFVESVERATRTTVPATLLRQKKTSSLTVAGEVAERQSFVGLNYRFDTVTLRRHHVLVAWLVMSRNSDKLADVLSGLSWID